MTMTPLRIIIVDDEPLARDYLRSLLTPQDNCEIVAECGDGESAIDAIRSHQPDLVFLDVQMPERSGIDVVESLGPGNMPHTVFVTAHNDYAVSAFEHHALDYLLKPFGEERFRMALDRAREMIHQKQDADWSRRLRAFFESRTGTVDDDPATQSASNQHQYMERIPVKTGSAVAILPARELEWIESADYYVNLHHDGKSYLLRESIQRLEESLDPQRFVRIHRGALVNVDYIRELQSEADGFRVILKDGTSLKLSRRRKEHLERFLGRRF